MVSMPKLRANITMNEAVRDRATKLMEHLGHSDFSGFLETLIREEWERRYGPIRVNERTAQSIDGGVPLPTSSPKRKLKRAG